MSLTPEEALKLLDHAASAAMGNRADHENIRNASRTLEAFIADTRANFVRKEDTRAND